MENVQYIPIYLAAFVSALVMTLVGWKLSTIISNPTVFLQPAVDDAARDIALVCDGKFQSKALTPPPPGASYLVMNCLDRGIAVGTSGLVAGYELYQAYKGIKDIGSAFKKGGLVKSASNLDAAFDIGKTVDVVDTVTDTGDTVRTLVMKADNIDDATDAVRAARETLGEAGDFRKSIDDILEIDINDLDDIPNNLQNTAGQSNLAKAQIDGLDSDLAELDDVLSNPELRVGDEIQIPCEDYPKACNAITNGGDGLRNTDTALRKTLSAAEGATGLGKDVDSAKISIEMGIKDKKSFKKLTELRTNHNGVIRNVRTVREGVGAVNTARMRTRRARYHYFFGFWDTWVGNRIVNLLGGQSGGIILEYIEDSGFLDLIEGSFVGVRYTPHMLNLISTKDQDQEAIDAALEIYRYSFNVSGEFMTVGNQLKEDIPRELRRNGYPETAGYIYNSEAEKLLLLGGVTNIDPTIVTYATTEYLVKLDSHCKDDECRDYMTIVGETGINISSGDASFEELRTAANSYTSTEITEIQEDFIEFLNYFEETDAEVQYITDASLEVQKQSGSWISENCETHELNLPDWDIEVASCAMVLDCTPEDVCYVGLPVVSANPWITYIPVTYLEGKDIPAIAQLAGMNYDSAAKVVTPGGLTGCGSISGSPEWEKAYICAMIGSAHRCKVVDCGKQVDVIFDYFEPSTWAEDRGSSVAIRGNLVKW